jgi:hypothetical protein
VHLGKDEVGIFEVPESTLANKLESDHFLRHPVDAAVHSAERTFAQKLVHLVSLHIVAARAGK